MQESDLLKRLDTIKTNADLFELLKEQPPQNWIKQHPDIPSYKYLPIDKCEFLLRSIFGFNYRIEVLDTKEIFNATSVSVRVHYRELETPFNWYYHDGVGADAPKKQDEIFVPYSVAASLPNAKSNAIKDACDHFGILFGSDLNRVDTISKDSKLSDKEKLKKLKELFEAHEESIPSKDYPHFKRIIENEEKTSYNKLLTEFETITKSKK